MKKSKIKGFTLIELLIAIIIICLIFTISFIIIRDVIKKGKSNANEIIASSLTNAAILYAKEYKTVEEDWEAEKDNLGNITGNEFSCTTVKQLINKGYLKDNNFGEELSKTITDNSTIKITRNQYKKIYDSIEIDTIECDKKPPQINLDIIGNTKMIDDIEWYYDSNNTVISINISGRVREYSYTIKDSLGNQLKIESGITVENYEKKLNQIINSDKKYGKNTEICVYAISMNDVENTYCKKINVDFTIPESPTLISNDSVTSGNWHKNTFELNITGGNSPSGIFYKYGILENEILEVANNDKITVNEQQEKTYYVISCNKIGICSNNTTYISKIDNEKPMIISLEKNTEDYKKAITLTAITNDKESGVVKYKITKDSTFVDSGWTTIDVTTENVKHTKEITENGTYYVWVVDKVGNYTSKSIVVNNIDNTKPTIVSFEKDTSNNAKKITLTAVLNDKESGIVKYKITKDSTFIDSGWTTIDAIKENITASKEITENGIYYVWVVDKIGNYNKSLINITNIDNEGPVYTGKGSVELRRIQGVEFIDESNPVKIYYLHKHIKETPSPDEFKETSSSLPLYCFKDIYVWAKAEDSLGNYTVEYIGENNIISKIWCYFLLKRNK